MASTIRQKAEVTVTVNGRNAQLMLDSLRQRAEGLRKAIALEEKAVAPDKTKLSVLQRQLRDVEKTMGNMQSSASAVEKVLRNMDRATPKELKKAVKEMERSLLNMHRGTEEWTRQAEQIRRAREALRRMNNDLKEQQTTIERMRGFWERYSGAIMGAVATITGLTLAARSAVNKYAGMEQEMANVRKYAGMTEEEVLKLNDAFKRIDTRTSREDLNKFAQDAGRLGKKSVEDVLGFVRAADKINVALDDLGSEATLTLSKLTGIFGDEERLGTEKAMLSVGSVINELSQNCTASAPYLAEFASRLGGVGAQAGLTVQQIMAYAAVLDSNNQALEASATALSQIMVRIYQAPQKYAKVAGLDAGKFTALVKKDMNEAMLLFLETLGKAGKMDTLSPMFKDMGENGSRAISALATLAGHVKEVRSQQDVANEAFREATSVITEFDVQNTTVQAGLDKAKNSFTEISVALGEELLPMMRYAVSSTSLMMKSMLAVVRYTKEHRTAIIATVATIAALVAVEKADLIIKGLKMLSYKNLRAAVMATNVAKVIYMATTSKTTVAQMRLLASSRLLRAMFMAVQVVTLLLAKATGTLTGAQQRTIATSRALQAAMTATPWGLVATAVLAAVAAITAYVRKQRDAAKAERERREEVRKRRAEYLKVSEAQSQQEIEELARLKTLREAIDNEKLSRDQRLNAAQKLIDLYPSYFKDMTAEKLLTADLASNYKAIEDNIMKMARARAVMGKIQDNYSQKLDLESDLDDARKEYRKSEALRDRYNQNRKDAIAKILPVGQTRTDGSRVTTADNRRARREADEWERKAREQQKRLENAAAIIRRSKPEIEAIENANRHLTLHYGREMMDWEKSQQSEAGTGTATGYTSQEKSKAGKKKPEIADWFKKALKDLEAARDSAIFDADTLRAFGEIDFREQRSRTRAAEDEYYRRAVNLYVRQFAEATGGKDYRTDGDYVRLIRSQLATNAERDRIFSERTKGVLERMRDIDLREVEAEAAGADGSLRSDAELRQKKMKIWDDYYSGLLSLHDAGSEEYYKINLEWERRLEDDRLDVRRQFAARLAEVTKSGETEAWVKEWRKILSDVKVLTENGLLSNEDAARISEQARKKARSDSGGAPGERDSEKRNREKTEAVRKADAALREGLIDKEDYARRIAEIEREFAVKMSDVFSGVDDQWVKMMATLYDSLAGMADAFREGADKGLSQTAAAVAASAAIVGAAFDQVQKFSEADMKIREKRITDYYDLEIEMAEGNTRTVKRLERDKERELADMKKRAAEKQFSMQVIAAIAQTATNALNAYGSAAAIPVVGHILAPIAAAAATAAGMVQVALIKKQQQAAEATGYAVGGYTGPGRRDDVAGVVHAGEWVAPAYMVNDPGTGAVISMLEQARVSHRRPTLTPEAVDRRLAAPAAIATAIGSAAASLSAHSAGVSGNKDALSARSTSSEVSLSSVLVRLADRLDEPFVTVNTVTGDRGIKQAQDKYNRLMRNKSK